ncbi:DUF2726 domain-containing protein [Halomonas elongata]|uniref:DUF2726 domain-containing protein n=1 Tax=Halomonas elongata TaxID=2746 RepID=UPI003D18D0FD
MINSHQQRDRRRRDAFVDRAFAAAGLPLLRIATQRRYDVAQLQQQLAGHLPLPPSSGTAASPSPAQELSS